MQHKFVLLSLSALLAVGGVAGAVPAPPPQPGMTGSTLGGVTAPNQGQPMTLNLNLDSVASQYDEVIGQVNNGFANVDTAIAMLTRILDIASAIPVFGAFAQGMRPVLNTYLDIKTTVQPLMDMAYRGRAYVQKYVDAKNTFQKLFASSNLQDVADNLNGLVNQVSGLPGFPNALRVLKADDPRGSTAKIAEGVTQMINRVKKEQTKAKAEGDAATYRAALAKEQELLKIRARIRQAGETAAALLDQKKIAGETGKTALEAAQNAQRYSSEMMAVQSDVGSLKLLGRIAAENLTATAAGFQNLSQQLALLSQQQTVTNEQNDQLLSHYQQEERKRIADAKAALEEETVRQAAEYKRMVRRSDQLADSIGQTLNPSSERVTDARSILLKGGQ